ncbi:CG15044, partial [Drosophila busckii]
RASDLDTSAITSVTDEERFCTLNPTVELIELKKVKHAKGNMVFSANDRIQGDKLLVNNYDDESFTTAVDIEVQLKYTSASGNTLTSIEIYVDASAGDANAYLVGGGIGKNTAHILLACNQTRTFSYEAYFYGY